MTEISDPLRLMESAMRGELPDSIRLRELAQLRAATFEGGFDHSSFVSVLQEMESRARAEQCLTETRIKREPTGEYRVRRPIQRHERGYSPNERRFHDPSIMSGCGIEHLHSLYPDADIEPVYRETPEQWIRRAEAQALFRRNPTNWSESARKWAGIDDAPAEPATVTSVKHSADDERVNPNAIEIAEEAGYTGSVDEQAKKGALLGALIEPFSRRGINEDRLRSFFSNLDEKKGLKAPDARSGQYLVVATISRALSDLHRSPADAGRGSGHQLSCVSNSR